MCIRRNDGMLVRATVSTVISDRGKTVSPAIQLRRHRFATAGRIGSLSTRLFTDVRIAPAAAASVRTVPARLFFHGANRSEAPAVPSLLRILGLLTSRFTSDHRATGPRLPFAAW